MSVWEKFDETKNFRVSKGVLLIRPNDKEEIIPLFCSVCDFPMKTSDDFLSFKDFSCCNKCKIYLAVMNLKEWKKGWRPEKNSEEYIRYISFRVETFQPTFRLI